MQKPVGDSAFALPGGHVEFGETNEQTLIREFKEEMDVDITVSDLKWVAENFFPLDDKMCQQICLYYEVKLLDTSITSNKDFFLGSERDSAGNIKMEFHWVPIKDISKINAYPTNITSLLKHYTEGVQHFVYHEV
jgi:ADP-ribose pyrophosphatase YjhB (NUDIX family)